jgi:hypothetical protein
MMIRRGKFLKTKNPQVIIITDSLSGDDDQGGKCLKTKPQMGPSVARTQNTTGGETRNDLSR